MTDFEALVYKKLKLVPRGQVTTYQALASSLGCPRGSRAVGNALNKNPYAPEVPCHRAVYSDGRLGGYAGGRRKKIALLRQEGIFVDKSLRLANFDDILYDFGL